LKDLITFTCILIGSFLMISFGHLVSISLISYIKGIFSASLPHLVENLSKNCLCYATPYAAGGILMQAALGLQYGMVFGVALAFIIGIYFPINLPLFILITTFAGCLEMVHVKSRTSYVKAGANVSVTGFAYTFAVGLVGFSGNYYELGLSLASALAGGLLCAFVVAGVAPIIEHLGGYVTDMTLLEIATLDHPLLKQLSVQAPGTWNHSMVMGMMAESAAQAIGANPVLARVSCYYHDIGKAKNPLYFVENQSRGENRHDKLSPSMSALIIRSHVKDGIKLAREHKIPEPVIDMIPQHHGTSVIEYFFEKAKKEAEESKEGEEVDKTLYTYPGPKPQTKEAGIIMLADGIEAAARTLTEPTHDRIQGLVQKMINKVFASGQLAECELTLRELHEIAKCFTRVLTGIYHQRVAYSEPAEKGGEQQDKKGQETRSSEERQHKGKAKEHGERASHGEPSKKGKNGEKKKEEKKEDLKRLGI
ncbi:MAG: HDIG domain-containing protein, partial [Candidatus Dadabacteria bacterium]